MDSKNTHVCTVRAPVFGRHQFFGTSEHYGKAHGSLLSEWMNYNYTACCWFPTSSIILILPSQFWQIRFESCWLHCSKCWILVLLRYICLLREIFLCFSIWSVNFINKSLHVECIVNFINKSLHVECFFILSRCVLTFYGPSQRSALQFFFHVLQAPSEQQWHLDLLSHFVHRCKIWPKSSKRSDLGWLKGSYYIRGYFCGGFIFREFRESLLAKISTSIYGYL